MNPSRAGSSLSSSWRIFSSARDLFHFSSELKIDWKRAEISILIWRPIFYYFYACKSNYSRIKTPFCATKIQINYHELDWNHNTWLLRLFDIHIVGIVSSVSARKLKCPSSARLSSEPSQLGLARAGKFQLELISKLTFNKHSRRPNEQSAEAICNLYKSQKRK